MALFSDITPLSESWTPLDEATGSTRARLALTGYRPDGSQNLYGKVASWIPGVGVIQNAQAQKIARQGGFQQVAGNIADDADNRRGKLMAQIGIAQGLGGLITGNSAMAMAGFQNTVQGVGSTLAAGNRPNYSNDGYSTQY